MFVELPYLLGTVGVTLLLTTAASLLWRRRRRTAAAALPADWPLTARPVFSVEERRVYRQLREALPHHIVLSKLPLVRFCQPAASQEVRYWYGLLGNIHVGFAICSANGRVLAAIDIDTERGDSRRSLQIKHKVLAACRVRYLRCPVEQLPSVPELQLLVPQKMAATRGPQATASPGGLPPRRDKRALWRDSGLFQDSFFGTDGRFDAGSSGDFGAVVRGLSPLDPLPPDAADDVPPVRH